jgi:nitroreductase
MEFHEAVRRRAMVRSFAQDAVATGVVEGIVRTALQAPSAGNTGGTAWVVLRGEAETEVYWGATTDSAWREASPRWEGLRRAPVILLAYSSAELYLERYAEPDKAASGLGTGPGVWPVPYWIGDAAFGVMTVLLAAVDAGLGACVMGNFRGPGDPETVAAVWRGAGGSAGRGGSSLAVAGPGGAGGQGAHPLRILVVDLVPMAGAGSRRQGFEPDRLAQ